MALNPGQSGDSHNWNYTKPDQPGYSTKLVGTVIAIQEVQAMNFGNDGRPTTPAFWDGGQPKMNIRIVLVGPKGGYRTLTFTPASKAAREEKRMTHLHLALFAAAGGKDMLDLVGKTIEISTDAPPAGFSYGTGNPRPWRVRTVEDQGPYQLAEELDPVLRLNRVLADQAVSGGQLNPGPGAGTAAAMATGAAAVGVPDCTAGPNPNPADDLDGEEIPF